jgi:predicted amidohydrolase
MICRDIGFPEIARALALKGAEILICSSAAGSIGLSTQARASDNSAYLIASNRIGEELGYKMPGDSRIIDPSGKIMAEAGNQAEGHCVAELDTDFDAETRNRRRNLQDYRPALFLSPGFYK